MSKIKFSFIFGILSLAGQICFAQEVLLVQAAVSSAHGMYVTNAKDVWLADTHREVGVKSTVYNMQGKPIKLSPAALGIAGISKHPRLNLFAFCDVNGSKILFVNSRGVKTRSLSVKNPWNARWTASGDDLYVVTHGGSVLLISGDNKPQEIIKGLEAPFDVAPIGENGLWVSEQGEKGAGRVCFYEKSVATGKFEKKVCNTNVILDNPEGLWPLKDGSVAAVDTGIGTLVKITPDGAVKVLVENLGIPILIQVLSKGDWVIFTNKSNVGPALIFGNSPELQIQKK